MLIFDNCTHNCGMLLQSGAVIPAHQIEFMKKSQSLWTEEESRFAAKLQEMDAPSNAQGGRPNA